MINEPDIVMTKSEDDCMKMMQFFCNIKNNGNPIEYLPCDDLLKGLKGFVAFYGYYDHKVEVDNEVYEEESIRFCWKFAEPINSIIDIKSEEVEELLKDCLESNWIRCDNPKLLKVGFLNYEKSECRHFRIFDIKNLSGEVAQLFRCHEDKRIEGNK